MDREQKETQPKADEPMRRKKKEAGKKGINK